MLTPGHEAPALALTNQHGDLVDIRTFRGRRVLVFFYPKASTPGCTQQVCAVRDVADQVGDGKLSFASAERLKTYLGVTPGSVSPFGLIHDTAHHVRVFLDRDLKAATRISFHPNINTRTLVLSFADFEKYLAASWNVVRFVDVNQG